MEYTPLVLTGLYALFSGACSAKSYRELTKQGWTETPSPVTVERIDDHIDAVIINEVRTSTVMPFHIIVGFIAVPIGGGETETSEHLVIQRFRGSQGVLPHTHNYECIDPEDSPMYKKQLTEVLDPFSEDKMFADSIVTNLPLKVYNHRMAPPVFRITDPAGGIIGTNRAKVISRYVMRTRLPFSFSAAAICAVGTGYVCFTGSNSGY